MESKINLMSQLIFKFPFKTKYYEQDFYVSSNNFSAYKLIENWPNWSSKWLNVFGSTGSGKTHLSKILEKKIKNIEIINAKALEENIIDKLENLQCLIIDNYENNIDQKFLYSLLNQSKQLENFILINSIKPISDFKYDLPDLKSRLDSFLFIGIDLPTDDLLNVIITKSFSDKQVELDPKVSDFIIKNVDRSYDKMFKFLKEVDELSLSSGKPININLIKKELKNEK
jgi:ATPase involved in DNA replication initiation